jgi:hypothetical protein
MSLVDFKQIPLYDIYPSGYPIYPASEPSGVYSETWGYFTFQQSINFEYNPRGHYKSLATFNINGVFTKNTSPSPSGIAPPSGYYPHLIGVHPSGSYANSSEYYEDQFNALKNKYNSLWYLLTVAASGNPPSNLEHYGTANDQRVVSLPYPLRGSGGSVVYGRPVSLEIDESRWPEYISYTASLVEVRGPSALGCVEGHCLNDAVITIKPKKARLKIQKFPFANSEEIYFGGYDPRSYQISGTLPSVPPSGALSTSKISDLVEDLMDGRCNIGKKVGNTETILFNNLYIDQSSVSIVKAPDGKGTEVSVSATDETA